MVTLDSEIFKCCHTIKTLGWANDSNAKRLLERAANQVKPIMAKRKWAIPLLCEFYPPAANLLGLNINHGSRIEIRVRSPQNRETFLPYESILGTLLHELVHIEVGPHNALFYKLLDEVERECEGLLAAGNDGTGGLEAGAFAGRGMRTGDWASVNVPRHLASVRARMAAEKRRTVGVIMGRGGGMLGGETANIAKLCDPREMALAAAERRRLDDERCGNGGGAVDEEVVDVTGGENIIVISDDEEVEVKEVPVRQSAVAAAALRRVELQKGKRKPRASSMPMRQNATALAALQRANRR